MRKLLVRVSLFFFPLLIAAVVAESLLRSIPTDSKVKAAGLKTNAASREILCLGSSHAFYGIDPESFDWPAFNAAEPSQTVDVDLAIFDRYKDEMPGLKFVIVSISSFTFHLTYENSPEKWRAKNYWLYHNINLSDNIRYKTELLSLPLNQNLQRLTDHYIRHINESRINEIGGVINNNNRPTAKELEETAQAAAARHNSSYQRSDSIQSRIAMKKLLDECRDRNIEVILFTPPGYKTYAASLTPGRISEIHEAAAAFTSSNNNVHYFDFLTDPSFEAGDFKDGDHLNHTGAVKLSRKLNDIIVSLKGAKDPK